MQIQTPSFIPSTALKKVDVAIYVQIQKPVIKVFHNFRSVLSPSKEKCGFLFRAWISANCWALMFCVTTVKRTELTVDGEEVVCVRPELSCQQVINYTLVNMSL